MRGLVLAVVAGLMTLPAKADEAADIAAVIGGQMMAFQARDVSRAFSFASDTIQGLFGNPATFGQMVAQGYPTVWDNAATEFLDLRQEGGRLVQRVRVTDAQGGTRLFDYEMVQTPEGWRIDGVFPVPEAGTGV